MAFRRAWVGFASSSALVGALGTACGEGSVAEPAPAAVDGVYPVTLSVGSASALPKCTVQISGTVARVATPSGLWSCQGSRWLEIPCTTLLAGAVAYASASHDLWACVAGQWTAVALPSGATGPTGPKGTTGAQGPKGDPGHDAPPSLVRATSERRGVNCATGGQRIDIGVDTDRDGQLDTVEIDQTTYVCNGESADSDDGEGAPSGGASGVGGAADVGGAPGKGNEAGASALELGTVPAMTSTCGAGVGAAVAISVRNTGATPLVVTAVEATGGFGVSGGSGGFTLAADASTSILLLPPPAVVGTDLGGSSKSGLLKLNVEGGPVATVNLSSLVVGANLSLESASGTSLGLLDFRGNAGSCPAPEAVVIRNSGNAPANVELVTPKIFAMNGQKGFLVGAQTTVSRNFSVLTDAACAGSESINMVANGNVCTTLPLVFSAAFDISGSSSCFCS